ncbi:universal stress protein [Variovorax sp. OV329]|uniref:universal stress protein n=1 Tax=Variovorax sp. OV329 TaxID=1882825 RepID=UPI0008E13160|nr:universal stress protein [Variovorax sp. OV329]SFN47073.1 Nucleotide-binding universal stress protein, UspA family [Variovorax sp. OV329]
MSKGFAMPPRTLLAVTDFSPRGNNALSRAALLSAQHGATLKLVYLAYPGEAPLADAATRLAHHALQLSQRHGIRACAVSRLAFTVEDLLPEVRRADLVVWGTAPVRGLRSFFMGKPVERFLRAARRPVLVVRREAKHDYRSLIVAVDFTQASRALVDVSFALNKSAQVELFHAVSTANEGKLRYAEVSDHAIKAYRNACRRYAQDRMFWLTDSYDSRRNRVLSAVGHGDAARQTVVQQENSGAELIVVGRHPSTRLSDLFFESTANRILGLSSTDVLVVPHDYEPASVASAVERLSSDSPAVRRVRAGAPEPPALPNPAAVFARAPELDQAGPGETARRQSTLLSFGWSAAAMGR